MMSLCSLISSSVSVEGRDYILFTFVVTEEWLGFISSDPKPSNIRFETLPNVIPSELVRAADFLRFVKATQTELEAPFEQLLNRLDPPPAAIIADAYLGWAVGVGNRRRIPVASLWPMSSTVFTVTDCFDLIQGHGHFPVEFSEKGDEHVDYIPGISSSMQVADLPTIFQSGNQELVRFASQVISQVPKAQCLIFNSIYDLEAGVLNALKAKFPFPVYTVGPVVPYLNLKNNNATQENDPNYWEWLDSQPRSSVLYVSLGSFLSVSSAQLDEIAAGLRVSGIRYLFMDLESSEGREMRSRAKEFQNTCRQAIEKGGSSATDLGAFVNLNKVCEIGDDGGMMTDTRRRSGERKEACEIGSRGKGEQEWSPSARARGQVNQSSSTPSGAPQVMAMDAVDAKPIRRCHVVVIPYPGRGHINPMMNLCKLISSIAAKEILITFVITEEWLSFIGSDPKPSNIRFATIPNVIPSELGRGADFPGFLKATMTKLEVPFERLLDRLESPVTAIVADTNLAWAVAVGNRRNIPVASLWTMSAITLDVLSHFELLVQNGHFPADLSENGGELVDYIPGISSIRLVDLPTFFSGNGRQIYNLVLDAISHVPKAQFILLTSIFELEPDVVSALRTKFPLPVYTTGPVIPYFNLQSNTGGQENDPNYLEWLDSQPRSSVLYVSLGSFLSVSGAQMDEIASGLRASGIRYLWVVRGEIPKFRASSGDMGMVVPWCDQLKVLCHPSVGGFWSHCGWNSTLESVYAGLPMLTFPIFWDQMPNSWLIVDEWKMGWRVKKESGADKSVSKEEIAGLIKRFMDLENGDAIELRSRAREIQKVCKLAIEKGGSSTNNLDAFVRNILECCNLLSVSSPQMDEIAAGLQEGMVVPLV
ncbi:UDP-glucuronosyl/UDP-glucosyltransferase [Dillenia turbinata]|uniref:UDP-glucuronosyl/UDP-glucosyltransferase n=1 Tax=Dillenia turbinata TaxID=194707 RepID=A0AAN8VK69_9MAGN